MYEFMYEMKQQHEQRAEESGRKQFGPVGGVKSILNQGRRRGGNRSQNETWQTFHQFLLQPLAEIAERRAGGGGGSKGEDR